MQKTLTNKVNYLIFLEAHGEYLRLTHIVHDHLNLEGKLAILTETRPSSIETVALQEYADKRLKKEKVKKKDIIEKAKNMKGTFYKYAFQRNMDIIDFAVKEKVDFKIVPTDMRYSNKIYQKFKEEDTVFPKLLETCPKFDKYKIDFYEEQAFGAWYTLEKIKELEEQGFKSFVQSVGVEHHPPLEHYLFQTERNIKFSFLTNDFRIHYWQLMAFFIPEYRGKYCLHCGKKNY